MAAIVRGVLRQRTAASAAIRHHRPHSTSNKSSESELDTERLLQVWRPIIEEEVANRVKKMKIMHDTNSNPFRQLYENLDIPNNKFKPSRFWRLNLFSLLFLSFNFGKELGEKHGKIPEEERQKISRNKIDKGNTSAPSSLSKRELQENLPSN